MTIRQQYLDAARAKGLRLDCRGGENVGTVYGDPRRFGLALSSLVDNAIKFTERGGISLIMAKARDQHDKVWVKIRVRDTGIGIAPDQHERIFAPFAQLDGTAARPYQGSGVGLALVKRIAGDMNGKVGVSSAPGAGSEFWLVLPFDKAQDRSGRMH